MSRTLQSLWLRVTSTVAPPIVLLAVLGMLGAAQSQTYTILYAFQGGDDGGDPLGLERDSTGNLFGITYNRGPFERGTIFRIDPAGNETTLFAFDQNTGSPSSLIIDRFGYMFGSTSGGGAFGQGIIFSLSPSGELTNLHDNQVFAIVTHQDATGALYGVTIKGGSFGHGTVFQYKRGRLITLYSFHGPEGDQPLRLVGDVSGSIVGITARGGTFDKGTVFRITGVQTKTYTLLHSFRGKPDGASPSAIFLNAAGDLYGATSLGGSSDRGTVFRITKGERYKQLYHFRGSQWDGWFPTSVVADASGTVFGTTGTALGGGGKYQSGSLFEIDPFGVQTVLQGFTSYLDGENAGNLILDEAGNLYGVATSGGEHAFGNVFRWTPQ